MQRLFRLLRFSLDAGNARVASSAVATFASGREVRGETAQSSRLSAAIRDARG